MPGAHHRRMSGSEQAYQSGQLVAGRYRIKDTLGSGGMAHVYRATDLAGGRDIALKVIRPTEVDPESAARFRREGELLAKLDNPAIVSLETFGSAEDGRLFLAMELLEGSTVYELLKTKGRLSPEEFAPILTGTVAGLMAAHAQGIIHRDLKPANIFLADDSSELDFQVKLVDFGISKVYGTGDRLTRTGQVLGTPRYMAPEQLAAEKSLDGRTDVYALGAITYEALTGSPAFVAINPSDLIVAILHGRVTPIRTLRPDLAEGIADAIHKAMAPERDARFRTPLEFAEAFLAALPAPPRDSKTSEPPPRDSNATEAFAGFTPDADRPSSPLRPGTFSGRQSLPDASAIPKTNIAPSEFRSASSPPTPGSAPEGTKIPGTNVAPSQFRAAEKAPAGSKAEKAPQIPGTNVAPSEFRTSPKAAGQTTPARPIAATRQSDESDFRPASSGAGFTPANLVPVAQSLKPQDVPKPNISQGSAWDHHSDDAEIGLSAGGAQSPNAPSGTAWIIIALIAGIGMSGLLYWATH